MVLWCNHYIRRIWLILLTWLGIRKPIDAEVLRILSKSIDVSKLEKWRFHG